MQASCGLAKILLDFSAKGLTNASAEGSLIVGANHFRKTMMTDEVFQQRFWETVDRSGGEEACWPWKGWRVPFGYGQVWTGKRTEAAHRVAYKFFHALNPGECVLHRCDNPSCCNPAHLYAGDRQQNMRDMRWRGRGVGRPLRPMDVLNIHNEHRQEAATEVELAQKYGVSRWYMRKVLNGEAWPDLYGEAQYTEFQP